VRRPRGRPRLRRERVRAGQRATAIDPSSGPIALPPPANGHTRARPTVSAPVADQRERRTAAPLPAYPVTSAFPAERRWPFRCCSTPGSGCRVQTFGRWATRTAQIAAATRAAIPNAHSPPTPREADRWTGCSPEPRPTSPSGLSLVTTQDRLIGQPADVHVCSPRLVNCTGCSPCGWSARTYPGRTSTTRSVS
jgi:hypothetical protein